MPLKPRLVKANGGAASIRSKGSSPSTNDEPKVKREKKPDEPGGRSEELANEPALSTRLGRLYSEIENGFDDQGQRSDNNNKWWDIYNCQLNDSQFYNGTSQIYVPIVMDAVNARKTRFVNQIFPQSGRYVQVFTEDGMIPDATVSLLEYYIKLNNLRNNIIPALMKSGDVEGQYTVYVDWATRKRDVAWREEVPAEIEGEEGLADPDETVEEIKEQSITIGFPEVEVIADNDVLVLPATASTADQAIEAGGSVTIIRRWSKGTIEDMIADGEIDEEAGNNLLLSLSARNDKYRRDTAAKMVDAAGIKQDARGKHCLVYETWTKLVHKGKKRIYRIYFAGKDRFLSCRRNPYWADTIPVISCAVNKTNGSFKGKSLVEPVATFQYAANDAVNQGMDSSAYALLPIVMTDPEKNPRVGSMILSQAAIWETSPKDTAFAQFPALWKDALEIVAQQRNQIFQSLSVNPSFITQGGGSKKPSQAEVANEQQVDVLTTADAVSVIEEGILTPMLHRMLEMDHQFRDNEITIYQHGALGIKAGMERVPPTSLNTKHYIKWFGVEAARNAQQIQQQIAAANVLRGIPSQLYEGYKLDLTPLIIQLVESAFGPNLAPLVFKDMRSQLTVDPWIENDMMMRGEDLMVHGLDNLAEHMQAHMEAITASGDPHGTIMVHMMRHRIAAAQMPMQAEGVPGTPGGTGPGIPGQGPPGQPGMPRIGAQPAQATGGQGPPGMVSQDSMVDPTMMPRL